MHRLRRLALRVVLLSALLVPALSDGSAASSSSLTLNAPVGVVGTPLLPPILTPFFAAAAHASGVPEPLLLALSYVLSAWSNHRGAPSIDGGYGLLDLASNKQRKTLDMAARLVHRTMQLVAHNDALNVRAGALLLAQLARAYTPGHRLPGNLAGWKPALITFAGLRNTVAAEVLVHEVGEHLDGVSTATPPTAHLHVVLSLPGAASKQEGAEGRLARQGHAHADDSADYPNAVWAPSPNYTAANRPNDLGVSYAVIHDTEGSCASALSWLDSTASGGSAHFLVCQDGTVFQLVHIHDIAWHAGNWYINQHSIGIEHEGFRDSGGYMPAQYAASAALLAWLANTYGLQIGLNRNAIIGHENVPNATHTDPGPFWDWPGYMAQVRGGSSYDGGDPTVAMVDVAQTLFYSCPQTSCSVVGSANWGEQFAPVTTSGGWTEVYYNGVTAWCDSTALTAGSGTRLRVTANALNVRDEPSTSGNIIGLLAQDQVYISQIIDRSEDPVGWWYIYYNHRYGFIDSNYVDVLGTSQPSTPPTQSATATSGSIMHFVPTPTQTPSPSPSATASPAISATATVTATGTVSITGTQTATATATIVLIGGATVVTGTIATTATTPSATVTATITVTPTATATYTPTNTIRPTATATHQPTATPTQRPTATPTRRPAAAKTRKLPARRTRHMPARSRNTQSHHVAPTAPLMVSLVRPHVKLGAPLRLRVHTSGHGALVRYRIVLPYSTTLTDSARTDRHGNAQPVFLLPGKRWLHYVLLRMAHRHHGILVMPRVPHSLGGTYSVTITWHGRALIQLGTFRIVLW